MSSERWRPVLGHEGAYEVSDRGRVRSLTRTIAGRDNSVRRVKGKILTPQIRSDKTPCANLWRDGTYQQIPIRRLVLEAFDKPQPAGHDAANTNGDPSDNTLTNLEWRPDRRLARLRLLSR